MAVYVIQEAPGRNILSAEKYGEYCVVLKREQVEKYSSLVFIKEDSLKYVDDDAVNTERLGQDIASRECVHFLAVLKHEEDIKSTSVDKWSSMVCCICFFLFLVTNLIVIIATPLSAKRFCRLHIICEDWFG